MVSYYTKSNREIKIKQIKEGVREIKNRRKRAYSEQKKRMSEEKQHGKKEWLRFFSE